MTEFVLTLSCPDRPGIVAAVSGLLASRGGNITESQQFGDRDTGRFFMRVQFTVGPAAGSGGQADEMAAALARLAPEFSLDWDLHDTAVRPRVLILVSRAGHCLNDLLFRQRSGQLGIDIAAVASNHPDLRPLTQTHGIDYHHLPVRPETRAAQENEILTLVGHYRADFVVLARYMQVLSEDFIANYPNRIINIHHSFLPAFVGAKPYHQAFLRGVKLIGATGHYVTMNLDEGPIIEQEVARVSHRDSIEDMIRKGRDLERTVLGRAVRLHLCHRVLTYGNKTVVFD